MPKRIPKSISVQPRSQAPIKTTFMELVQALTRATQDDDLVLAMIKNIFASYRVRLGKSLVPVRLVNSDDSGRTIRRSGLGKKSAAWA
jgi:hypothetical protein